MKRRNFLVAAAALAAAPARAQTQAKPRRIAVLSASEREPFKPLLESFVAALEEHGYVQGKSVELDVRYGDRVANTMSRLLRDALAAKAEVIVLGGLANAKVAKEATSTIPVVVFTMSDPADAGIVSSLARPGGNLTGLADLADETTHKRLEVAAAATSKLGRLILLLDPAFPATTKIEARLNAAKAALRVPIDTVHATDRATLDAVVSQLGKTPNEVLVAGPSSLVVLHSRALIDGALARRVPVVHYWTGTAEQGALLSHGVDIRQNMRRAAHYVDRILKGARPADLPIEQPSKYELIINLRTAKHLGISISRPLLVQADQVIE